MKTLLLFGSLFLTIFGFSQTTLFQDDFESGSTQWSLNTGSGANSWLVNNVYLGFAGLIPDTPNQPGAITNSPQSTYMHITNQTVCGGLNVCNANFDTGSASDQNTEIATSIDASGYTNVTVSFWYLCAGQTNVSFGTMEYSIDGGSTWVGTGTNYVNTASWTLESVSLPAWDNVAAFKVRFKWQNGGGGLDPAFSIDEVAVSGMIASNAITTDPLPIAGWCFGSAQNPPVSFDAIGTYNAGNVFTAQLSDASGSFASPTDIGSLTSSASGPQMILSLIPNNIPVGTGYRIRVVASDPVTIGTDNGIDLVVYPLPTVTLAPFADVCLFSPTVTLSGGSPTGGTYSGQDVQNNLFFPNTVGTSDIFYSYSDANGCSNTASQTITVNPTPVITVTPQSIICDFDSPFELLYASPTGGTYSGAGVVANIFSPSVAGVGVHSIQYQYTDANGCSTVETFSLEVEVCLSVSENALIGLSIYPNPTEDLITITADVELTSIVLVDVNGRIVQSIDQQGAVNVSDLELGVYFVRMENDGRLFTERIIIK